MDSLITFLNTAGKYFVDFSTSMLIQSSVLIAVLLVFDLFLRKKVRAVFRYCIWMLVLVKLILPTTLASPTGLAYWLGHKLPGVVAKRASIPEQAESLLPGIETASGTILPATGIAALPSANTSQELTVDIPAESGSVASTTTAPLSWQAFAFLGWLAVVIAMVLLLIQRMFFVRGLLTQSKELDNSISNLFRQCKEQMSAGRHVSLKLSPVAASPSVCGLLRPTILIPQNLPCKLKYDDLRSILLHELAHIKRGDLWVSLIQAILQIAYFYNFLFWVANAAIRKVREQAVDEMVLVAMGEQAEDYPETLLNISRLTFSRPVLSLRLIGVVESKKALHRRIKHMLSKPIPKNSKLGILGLIVVTVIGSLLLPMGPNPSAQGSVKTAPKGLDEAQKAYAEWTEERFADYLDRSEYAGLSDSTKAELEEKWISVLQGPWSKKYYDTINCLAAIKSKKAVKPLLKVAVERREKDNRDRWMATRALGIIGDDSVVPELIHLVYHYNQNTRFWAQISLVRLTGQNFGTDWQQWGKWWNDEGKKPAFSNEKIQWTTSWAEYADPEKQKESDRKFVEKLMGAGQSKGIDERRQELRKMFQQRLDKDRQLFSPQQLQEIESLYRVANNKWNSPEAKQNLQKLISLPEYARANRVGCAMLYLGQMSEGQESEEYLKTAIEKHDDCWYGDGVQVGAYARYCLANYYQQTSRSDDAEKLFKELRENYPDAIDHNGHLLADRIPTQDSSKTYIVSFKGISGFRPTTAMQLLASFNKNLPRGVRTHHFRTEVKDGELVGHICVDTDTGKDAVVTMLKESKELNLIEAKLADQDDLDKLYKMGQPGITGYKGYGVSAETYIVSFKGIGGFRPTTAMQLLTSFNKNYPRGVRTHHFRTEVKDGELVGHICVDTDTGKDAVVAMLNRSRELDLIEVKLADQDDLDKLYKMGQPGLF